LSLLAAAAVVEESLHLERMVVVEVLVDLDQEQHFQ
jgi:hypothetical protein